MLPAQHRRPAGIRRQYRPGRISEAGRTLLPANSQIRPGARASATRAGYPRSGWWLCNARPSFQRSGDQPAGRQSAQLLSRRTRRARRAASGRLRSSSVAAEGVAALLVVVALIPAVLLRLVRGNLDAPGWWRHPDRLVRLRIAVVDAAVLGEVILPL